MFIKETVFFPSVVRKRSGRSLRSFFVFIVRMCSISEGCFKDIENKCGCLKIL